GTAQEHPADPAESVNPDFYRHRSNPPLRIAASRTLDKSGPDVQILRRAASRMQWAWRKGNHFIEMWNPPWFPTSKDRDSSLRRLRSRMTQESAHARASIPARFSSCHSEPPRRRIPGVEWARLTAARKDRDSSLRRLRSE